MVRIGIIRPCDSDLLDPLDLRKINNSYLF